MNNNSINKNEQKKNKKNLRHIELHHAWYGQFFFAMSAELTRAEKTIETQHGISAELRIRNDRYVRTFDLKFVLQSRILTVQWKFRFTNNKINCFITSFSIYLIHQSISVRRANNMKKGLRRELNCPLYKFK